MWFKSIPITGVHFEPVIILNHRQSKKCQRNVVKKSQIRKRQNRSFLDDEKIFLGTFLPLAGFHSSHQFSNLELFTSRFGSKKQKPIQNFKKTCSDYGDVLVSVIGVQREYNALCSSRFLSPECRTRDRGWGRGRGRSIKKWGGGRGPEPLRAWWDKWIFGRGGEGEESSLSEEKNNEYGYNQESEKVRGPVRRRQTEEREWRDERRGREEGTQGSEGREWRDRAKGSEEDRRGREGRKGKVEREERGDEGREEGRAGNPDINWLRKLRDDFFFGEGVLFDKELEEKDENGNPSPPGQRLTRRQKMDLIAGPEEDIDEIMEDEDKFKKWKLRRDTLKELKDYQTTGRDPDDDIWEDWIDDSMNVGVNMGGWYENQSDWETGGVPRNPPKVPERGMSWTFKDFFFKMFGREEEVEADLTFEERIFRYTSQTTAKFFSFLVVVPLLTGTIVHDYALVPFVERWVETTPLVASMLDVRQSQKLVVIEELKMERQRVRFEAEIGKTPPLDDEELAEHMHEEASLLFEEVRAENRSAFANIWSDTVVGFTGYLIYILSPKKVSIMRMTGDRIFTNISDTGKAFVIILFTDIFLGYHSETGWETIIDMFLEHYGLESDQASIYIFVATVPVTLDVCFKLWVFKYLTRLSPSAAATFREMKRH